MFEDRVYIADVHRFEGKEVKIYGWLYNIRYGGKIIFLLIRDGTGIIQSVLLRNEVSEETYNLAHSLTIESSLSIRGVIRRDDRAPGGYELTVKSIELFHRSEEYPISKKEHGVAFLMELRHLWLRSKKQNALLRIRAEVIAAIRDFFDKRGFVNIDAPILTPIACEGTTTLFETEYFGEKAYLTQSGQLYMEAACMAFGKVYCFGPTFRAEKSKTRRHLTEFWMVEPEVAYLDLEGDMRLAEDLIMSIIDRVLDKKREELEILGRNIDPLLSVKKPFPRLTYTEVCDLLNNKGSPFRWGDDLGGDEETMVSKEFDSPVIIHRYPVKCKPFYMKIDPENPELVLNMDILAPEGYGEIIGGSQREDDYDTLKGRILELNLPLEPLSWYLDLRRYGSVPHSGFGIGLERTVAWLSGIHHVREAIPFPRTIEKIWP